MIIPKVQDSTAATLYWLLPGPAAFLESLTAAFKHSRAIAIHIQSDGAIGSEFAIDRAVARSHFESEQPVRLKVEEATHVASDIGHHFNVASLDPSALASMGNRTSSRRIVVLSPNGLGATQKCHEYLGAFTEAARHQDGCTTLAVIRHDRGAEWKPSDGATSLSFTGALTREEMKALVGMRMVGRRGPGSTSLTQHMVAEFAGFDASFAERLMKLSEHDLLALPRTLSAIGHEMPSEDSRWRETSLESGTIAEIDGELSWHVLHEWHLASHSGPMREAALKSLSARRWRAFMHALMPWLEETRHGVIDILRPLLRKHLASSGGKRILTFEKSGRTTEIEINDLECNDIAGMYHDRPRLEATTDLEKDALSVCRRVSRVRNELAHMRAPETNDVQELVRSMDELLFR